MRLVIPGLSAFALALSVSVQAADAQLPPSIKKPIEAARKNVAATNAQSGAVTQAEGASGSWRRATGAGQGSGCARWREAGGRKARRRRAQRPCCHASRTGPGLGQGDVPARSVFVFQ